MLNYNIAPNGVQHISVDVFRTEPSNHIDIAGFDVRPRLGRGKGVKLSAVGRVSVKDSVFCKVNKTGEWICELNSLVNSHTRSTDQSVT